MVKSLNKDNIYDVTPIIAYDKNKNEIGMGWVADNVTVNVIVSRFKKDNRVSEIRVANNLLWKRK